MIIACVHNPCKRKVIKYLSHRKIPQKCFLEIKYFLILNMEIIFFLLCYLALSPSFSRTVEQRKYFWKRNFPMNQNVCLSVGRSVGLSVCRSVYLSVGRSAVCLSVGLSECWNVRIFGKCRKIPSPLPGLSQNTKSC